MKTSSKLLGTVACALAFVAATSHAQTNPSGQTNATLPSGLLGRTYTSFNLGLEQIRHEVANPTGFVADADVNLPIDDGFDYHVDFGYQHAAKTGFKLRDTLINNGVTYYYRTHTVTPFLTAGFGYDWSRATVRNVTSRNNHLSYGAATGVEVPMGTSTAVRLALDFDQSVRHPRAQTLNYQFSTNHWFNDTVGASLGAIFRQGYSGAHDATVYTAGMHFSFD